MHELSIAQAIVDVVEEEARAAEVERVLAVVLSLGELAGVVEEQLRFCFPVVAQGTVVEGATLEIEPVEGRGWCARCEREFRMPSLMTPCPACGEFTREVRAGQELRVVRLEVE